MVTTFSHLASPCTVVAAVKLTKPQLAVIAPANLQHHPQAQFKMVFLQKGTRRNALGLENRPTACCLSHESKAGLGASRAWRSKSMAWAFGMLPSFSRESRCLSNLSQATCPEHPDTSQLMVMENPAKALDQPPQVFHESQLRPPLLTFNFSCINSLVFTADHWHRSIRTAELCGSPPLTHSPANSTHWEANHWTPDFLAIAMAKKYQLSLLRARPHDPEGQ